MRRFMFCALIALSFSAYLVAEKKEKDLVLLREFSELNYKTHFIGEKGLLAPWMFDERNRLYTVTPDTRQYRVYNSRLGFEKEYTVPYMVFSEASGFMFTVESMLVYRELSGIYILRKQGKDYPFDTYGKSNPAPKGFLFGSLMLDMVQETSGRSPRYIGFILPEDPQGRVAVIQHEQLMKELQEGRYRAEGLELRDGMILYHGQPFFLNDLERLFGKVIPDWKGWDKDYNYVGDKSVWSRNGMLLETFNLPFTDPVTSEYLYMTRFYDQEGNFYTFKGRSLYYIGRDWGYSNPRLGVLNESQVRLRLHPGTSETILGAVDKGTQVTIFEETEKKETIGGKTAPWYKVKIPSGLVGWVFGAFVDIKK